MYKAMYNSFVKIVDVEYEEQGTKHWSFGTPYVIDNLFELLSFMLVYWDLPEKNLWNHLSGKPLIL